MSLVAAAAAAIKKEFGEKTVIYEEASEQGFDIPSFFIRILSDNVKEEFCGRFSYRCLIEVIYFPEDTAQTAIEEARLRLSLALASLSGIGRAEKIESRTEEETVQVMATYRVFYGVKEAGGAKIEKMEALYGKIKRRKAGI